MLRPRLIRSDGKVRAQALVEFSLTALWLVMALMLVIEVARIFQAYVTLQGAARAGGRYAITGQWEDKYAGDPTDPTKKISVHGKDFQVGIAAMSSGWDPTSPDPLKHIAPCWPRFRPPAPEIGGPYYAPIALTTPAFQEYYPYTISAPIYNEPYRDPRTCSIEATVIRAMTGLPLDPVNTGGVTNVPSQPYAQCCWASYDTSVPRAYTYTIHVWGYALQQYPEGGTIGHPDYNDPAITWDGSEDFSDVGPVADGGTGQLPASEGAGLSHGYGGDPGQQVSIQIEYRLGMITPILSRIVPYVTLSGTATMTNEFFGSTGVQSNAVLPPPLPAVNLPNDPTPPDLVVDSISGPAGYDVVGGVVQAPPNTNLPIDTEIFNQGGQDTPNPFYVRMYYNATAITSIPIDVTWCPTGGCPLTPAYLAATSSFKLIGEQQITSRLDANAVSDTLTFTANFPTSATYYVYVVADAQGNIDETGIGTAADPTRENNNVLSAAPHVAAPYQLDISSKIDLETYKVTSKRAPAPGESFTYTIGLRNIGIAAANNVTLTDTIPAQLTVGTPVPSVGSVSVSGNTVTWTIPVLPKNVTFSTLTIPVTVIASTPKGTSVPNTISGLTVPDQTDTNPNNNPPLCVPPGPGIDDCKSVTVIVGAIDLGLSKSVSNPNPTESPDCNGANAAKCFNYILTATNYSTVTAATNVSIVDTLPAGIVYVSSTKTGGGSCTQAGQVITCAVGTIAGGGANTATATITVRADTATGGKTLVNSATVSATEADADLTNNTSTASVLVQSVDIDVKKSVNPLYTPTSSNGTDNKFVWTITVTNKGINDANNIQIKDTFDNPSYLTGLPSGANAPTYTVSTGTWSAGTSTWTIPSLPAKGAGTATMTITATAKTTSDGKTVTNTAEMTSVDKADSDPNNNKAFAKVTITNAESADLQVVKTVSPNSAVATGTKVTYTFVVTNNGPKPVDQALLTDVRLSQNADLTGTAKYFTYDGGVAPPNWNRTTGEWTKFHLDAGKSATYTMTLVVNGNEALPIFNNAAHISSERSDQDLTNNDSSARLQVYWPSQVFTNAGGPGCNNVIFGDTNQGLDPHPWEPSFAYSKGGSGFYGRYTSNVVQSGYNFIDFLNNPINDTTNPDGKNLLGCTISGSNFNYRKDNMKTGLYDIVLVFTDPTNLAGTHRFKVDFLTNKTKAKKLLVNYDINYDIEARMGFAQKAVNGNVAHYIVKIFTVQVKGKTATTGWLRLHFYNGQKKGAYKQTYGVLSGLGLIYRGS